MNKHTTQILTLELVWWLATAIIGLMVYLRVSSGFETYPFLFQNMVFIATFVTFTRWDFLLRLSAISLSRNLMILLIFISIPIFLYILSEYRSFKIFWDDGGLFSSANQGPYEHTLAMANFFRKEMFFFSIGSMIAIFIFPFRVVGAVWRKHNTGHI